MRHLSLSITLSSGTEAVPYKGGRGSQEGHYEEASFLNFLTAVVTISMD